MTLKTTETTSHSSADTEPSWMVGLPHTRFIPKVHPLSDQIIEDVHTFFLEHWPFPNERARKKFVGGNFAYGLCASWPESLDERIHHACQLFTLLFLVDASFPEDEGRAYNDMVLSFMDGKRTPNHDIPVEWITYDIWESMRACDPVLSAGVLETMAPFMYAQTASIRVKENVGLKEYLEWGILDIGGPLITATALYCTGLVVPQEDMALVAPLDDIWVKHLIYCNDAWSYDKELRTAQEPNVEAITKTSADCSSVQAFSSVSIIMEKTGVPASAAKRVLVFLQREMEVLHEKIAGEVLAKKATPEVQRYIKILEYQMSGNELWTSQTLRYNFHA